MLDLKGHNSKHLSSFAVSTALRKMGADQSLEFHRNVLAQYYLSIMI